jgi:hypothetical protein
VGAIMQDLANFDKLLFFKEKPVFVNEPDVNGLAVTLNKFKIDAKWGFPIPLDNIYNNSVFNYCVIHNSPLKMRDNNGKPVNPIAAFAG